MAIRTLFCGMIWVMLLYTATIYGSPFKRSPGQQATDCYGTGCEVDLDIPTETIIDIAFPENLTQAIMTALPNIEGTQNTAVALLENMTTTINHRIQNLTLTMANVANLLQSQLGIMSERLLRPPPARDCQDIAACGGANTSGSYTITPRDGTESFRVYCDMATDSGGWTVFQRRFNGSVDFNRGWDDYVQGFGSPDGEYWAGLRQIYRLTRNGKWVLRIDMEDFDGSTEYAQYESFRVGTAGEKYPLTIGVYSGNGHNELKYHSNRAFTTKDSDNDIESRSNCALTYKGGWWYKYCFGGNLNGVA